MAGAYNNRKLRLGRASVSVSSLRLKVAVSTGVYMNSHLCNRSPELTCKVEAVAKGIVKMSKARVIPSILLSGPGVSIQEESSRLACVKSAQSARPKKAK